MYSFLLLFSSCTNVLEPTECKLQKVRMGIFPMLFYNIFYCIYTTLGILIIKMTIKWRNNCFCYIFSFVLFVCYLVRPCLLFRFIVYLDARHLHLFCGVRMLYRLCRVRRVSHQVYHHFWWPDRLFPLCPILGGALILTAFPPFPWLNNY